MKCSISTYYKILDAELYDIDKTIVENAAQHFDGARDFLKAIK